MITWDPDKCTERERNLKWKQKMWLRECKKDLWLKCACVVF